MTLWTYGFEEETSGTAIATTDTPTGGDTAWSAVTLTAGASAIYDSTHAHSGTNAGAFTPLATSSDVFVAWTSGVVGTLGQLWFRSYCYFSALPTNTNRIFGAYTGSTQGCVFAINSSGHLTMISATPATMSTGTFTIPAGAWFRVEGTAFASATVGWGEVKTFATTPEGTTPDETLTSASTFNTGASFNAARFGQTANIAGLAASPWWQDDVAVSSTAYPGPLGGGGTNAPAGLASATGVPPAASDSVALNMTIQGV